MSELKAVIQAGGRGTRLAPYSTVLPKALMPVGEGTVIDHLLSGFRDAGVAEVIITVSRFGPLIRSYCGDGSRWNLSIDYITEDVPLGTIGGLNLLRERLEAPFFVANSDIYTDLELKDLLATHSSGSAALTVVVTRQTVNIGYGVVDHTDGLSDRVPREAQPGVLREHRDLLHESRGLRVHPAVRERSASTTSCAPCWTAARRSASTSTWAAGSTSGGSRTCARPRNRPRTRSPRTRSV